MVVEKRDVGRRVRFREKDGNMREGVLLEVKPNRYAVVRYAVPGNGVAAVVLSLQGEGAHDRVEVIA